MPTPPSFKTASWRGVIHPVLHPPNELVTLSIRLPKDLADDVELAVHEYRRHFDSTEELIATAVGFAINSLTEEPPPIHPKVSPKNRHSKRRRQKSDTSFDVASTVKKI